MFVVTGEPAASSSGVPQVESVITARVTLQWKAAANCVGRRIVQAMPLSSSSRFTARFSAAGGRHHG